MEVIKQYIISVCAAAILCGIIKTLAEKTGASSSIIRALCGVVLTITAIRPLLIFPITDISDVLRSYRTEGEHIANQAVLDIRKTREEIIIDRLRTYILDKAASLGASIEVEIFLDENETGVPVGAIIHGSISPYGKQRLTEILASELGIQREAQQWMN